VYLEGALLSKISLEQRVKHFAKPNAHSSKHFVSKKEILMVPNKYPLSIDIIKFFFFWFVLAGALW
jgi:hypothetical protein